MVPQSQGPISPESGKNEFNDDPLDFMNVNKRADEFVENTNESYNHPTKTPSTAENNSVKGHISFESHSKNLLNENITNFESPKNNPLS